MAAQTIHVVIAFTANEDGVAAEPPTTHQSGAQARAVAQRLAEKHVGVIAWSRSADPDVGEYGDPTVIVRLGTIPDWFDEGGGVE